MNETVRYTERWNGVLLKPIAGYDWLSADDAHSLYQRRPGPGVMVVGGHEEPTDGTFSPDWVIGFGVGPGVRVVFYDPHGTVVRLVDYAGVDDRLWRQVTVDYTYASDARRWMQNEYLQEVKASVHPDGTGHLAVVEASDPTTLPSTSSTAIQAPVRDSYWLDRPEFGDWGRLADPGPSAWEVAGESVPTRTS
ncbi:MAG: hypothetical protein ACRDS9_09940 [Pseudonocardiaceae bacterium]